MDCTTAFAASLALAPGVLGFALSRITHASARRARALTRAGAGLCLLLTLGLIGATAFAPGGTAGGPLPGASAGAGALFGAPPLVRVDGLTLLMAATVGLIGFVVARFSERYLDGDPRQARFCQWLSFTVSAVLTMVVTGHLLVLVAAWIAAGHGLDALLRHRNERPGALRTARARRYVARIGELCLVAVLVLSQRAFGSLDLAVVLEAAAAGTAPASVEAIAWLLVLAAMTMSVQLPFEGWLPDSMETPTPVSALMHAGLVNAGGFLLLRTSPLLVEAPLALGLLAVVGASTAIYGALVMLVQTDIKRKYAYSTVSQMGFMMLQCGLGAFGAAAMHLVGHSFYKGHAFLSAASQVDPSVPRARAGRASRPGPAAVTGALLAGLAAVAIPVWLLELDPSAKPGLLVLGAILALAVAQVALIGAAPGRPGIEALVESLLLGAGFSLAYFVGLGLFEGALAGVIPTRTIDLPYGLEAGLVALFALVFVAQLALSRWPDHPLVRRAWVHASNGFYLDPLRRRLRERMLALAPSLPPIITRRIAPEGGR
ncbi:MAG: hypothetical protein H6748_00335 [Spirochaetaceae bacterium]|nr:hypothetical protein [Myxococcales bacterium]MCB9722473.1 hypothetical protein [Spirochaetaceae bacterium]HPG26264.1 proton-conducting transporter membrane subunit [Myxococcota bacterium]